MGTTLLTSGSIRINDEFISDSQSLYQLLRTSIAWDERLRARKAMSFGVPYNYSGMVWPAHPFPDLLESIRDQVSRKLDYPTNNCLAHYLDSATFSHGEDVTPMVPTA